ncbi:MAG: NAD-dependent malic enzyme [Candidatus Rokuibacteriota bacterium]|nr:MAG: NAD-dependent malic enzyme [Candidatus Rokubacteria bacterium]
MDGVITPSASYSFTVRLQIPNRPGMLGRVASAIGDAGGDIGAVDLVETTRDRTERDITVKARDGVHAQQIVNRLRRVGRIRVGAVSDRTFLMHLTDGTAVLGLGDIGPEAALPVMEGKAMLFKEFAGVDAFPICLATKEPDKIVETVKLIAPAFGGINLEDIAAPRCFEVEDRLRKELDIPVFHDDQHGTAVVVLAALLNALKIVRKEARRIRVVVTGVGAAGTATIKILQSMGVRDIIGVDEHGTIHRGRTKGMDFMKRWAATSTNPRRIVGSLGDALAGADVFIGLSVPGILTVRDLSRMARDPIVFAMANPEPEIRPEEAGKRVRVMATGRSDYANQINNVLCFPGFFRGLLDARARSVNDEMKLAAARALAACVSRSELSEEYIIPSVFNKSVAPAVAEGVVRAAAETATARRRPRRDVAGIR